MNILVPHSWLKEYLHTNASPRKIADALTLHSASVERLIKKENDWIYDIEITGNRVDMASIVGLARETSVVLNHSGITATFKPLTTNMPKSPYKSLPITIKNNPELCNRILAVVIDDVTVGKSPSWMTDRLEKSGVRSLNTIVDVTNYVMLETGHPTHVFDYDRIRTNKLVIRLSRKNEEITLFDGKRHILQGGDIIIDDGTGTIIDLPGIAGAKNSVVTGNTKRILFFIESNDPKRIRQTSMSLGIHTYASHMNKNRPDTELSETALLRGIELYEKIARGKVASRIFDDYPRKEKKKTVTLTQKQLDTYMGISVEPKSVTTILAEFGFDIKHNITTDSYTAVVPSWRANDVSAPEDLIEEVARIYGYHNLPKRVVIGTPIEKREDAKQRWISIAKHALSYWGFTELYSFSLVSGNQLTEYGFDINNAIKLKNPLTEEGEYMRPSLIPNLLGSISINRHRRDFLKLFELSRVYIPRKHSLPHEKMMLSIALFCENEDRNDFFRAKGVVKGLVTEMKISHVSFSHQVDNTHPLSHIIHPLQRASILIDKAVAGLIGRIGKVLLIDLDFELMMSNASQKQTYTPIPSYPPIIEDITITLPKNTYIGPVMDKISTISKLIKSIELIDKYNQNYTFRIVFQDSHRNLTDTEVGEIKIKIIDSIKTKYATTRVQNI